MIVSQLMSKNTAKCRAHDSLQDAAGMMWEKDIGCWITARELVATLASICRPRQPGEIDIAAQ
jgi:hypothetical protein